MNRSMKPFQNLFTHKILMIKSAVKELQSAKFCAILLVSVVLAGIFSLSPAISSLMNDVIITSTGRITTKAPITYKSEIRGMFINYMGGSDWDLIAQTCKDNGINMIVGEFLETTHARYPSDIIPQEGTRDELALALEACHSRGLELHVLMCVICGPFPDEYKAVDSNGNLVAACPTRLRELIGNIVEELVTKYPDIDGFMYDFVRYEPGYTNICYCDQCKADFEEWLGEGSITDWTPFYPGGTRNGEFMNWRNVPITNIVSDIHSKMKAIKPDLKFSVAAWTLFSDCPTYWRYYIGQDTADWIRQDYLDMVAPMNYETDLGAIEDQVRTNLKYWTAGPEGKIPLVAFLTTGISEAVSPDLFKQEVDLVRSLGLDGWIIWRYGGPGYTGPTAPDITQYLPLIDLPEVFTLGNIGVTPVSETEEAISWTTDLPATSKVEYSTSPLFTANRVSGWQGGTFPYWDIDHVTGTIIQDATPVTNHNITLTGLSPRTKYYFRVQSEGSGGIVTSKVLTFIIGEVTS